MDIKPFAAKAAENILRVAGMIQAFGDPHSNAKVIEDKAIKGSICLMLGHYLKEALRLTTRAEPSTEMVQAQKLLEWARETQEKCKGTFTIRYICQYGPGFARSKSKANTLLKLLVEYGWVVSVGDGWQIRKINV